MSSLARIMHRVNTLTWIPPEFCFRILSPLSASDLNLAPVGIAVVTLFLVAGLPSEVTIMSKIVFVFFFGFLSVGSLSASASHDHDLRLAASRYRSAALRFGKSVVNDRQLGVYEKRVGHDLLRLSSRLQVCSRTPNLVSRLRDCWWELEDVHHRIEVVILGRVDCSTATEFYHCYHQLMCAYYDLETALASLGCYHRHGEVHLYSSRINPIYSSRMNSVRSVAGADRFCRPTLMEMVLGVVAAGIESSRDAPGHDRHRDDGHRRYEDRFFNPAWGPGRSSIKLPASIEMGRGLQRRESIPGRDLEGHSKKEDSPMQKSQARPGGSKFASPDERSAKVLARPSLATQMRDLQSGQKSEMRSPVVQRGGRLSRPLASGPLGSSGKLGSSDQLGSSRAGDTAPRQVDGESKTKPAKSGPPARRFPPRASGGERKK